MRQILIQLIWILQIDGGGVQERLDDLAQCRSFFLFLYVVVALAQTLGEAFLSHFYCLATAW